MKNQVIPWPEEGMTVADLVKLLLTLPPVYKVEAMADYHGPTEIEIDDQRERVILMVEI